MDTGKYDYTSGTAASLVAGKRATVTAGLSSALTMGVTTSISVGGTNAFNVGINSSIGLSASLNVTAGYSFSISKTATFEQAQSGAFLHTESYVGKVGAADTTDNARYKTLSRFAWIMVALQTATALASLGMGSALLAEGSKGTENSDGTRSGESDKTIPIIFVDLTQSALTVLTLIVTLLYGRYTKSHRSFDANAVLSMDEEAALFLGIKKSGLQDTHVSGALLNERGISLSTAKQDLEFSPGGKVPTIIGYKDKPDADGVPGSRFQLETEGNINAWGETMTSTAKDVDFFVDQAFRVERKPNEDKGKNKFLLSADELRLNHHTAQTSNDLSLNKDGITATATNNTQTDGSHLELTQTSVQLKAKGDGLEVGPQQTRLTWGQKALVIDANGVTIGDEIKVINPGPGANNIKDLQTLVNALKALDGKDTTHQQTLDAQRTSDTAKRNTTETAQKTKLTARLSTEDANPPQGNNP